MADGDTLAGLGQKLTDLFASAYAANNPNVSLAFLPFAIPVPDDIVQGGVVNPARMTQFLAANFDTPYLVSPTDNSAHGEDGYYGSISQIYATAATLAQSAAPPGTDAAKRVNAEIAIAQSLLNPAGVSVNMGCEPDDWILDGGPYWTAFDSSTSQGASSAGSDGSPPPGPRLVNPALWTIRAEAAPLAATDSLSVLHAARPAVARPLVADVVAARPAMLASTAVLADQAQPVDRPLLMKASPAALVAATAVESPPPATPPANRSLSALGLKRYIPIDPPIGPAPAPAPPAPPSPPRSSVSIHFEHMSVTIGYMAAGVPVLNHVFLADQGWYIAGLARGGLLPDPSNALPLVYGLPTALVVVRNVSITVNWAGQDQASLGAGGGFLGPFPLSGGGAKASDGTCTYARPGMQVIALLCSRLPVLPPIDAPDLTSAAATPPSAPSPSESQPPSPSPPQPQPGGA